MGRYVIGVDNGGTFIKAALYDEHGRMVSLAREASRTIIPEPGRVEINLNELWAINCRCIAQVLAESGVPAGEVECVGFAGQGKGVYAVDSNGIAFRNGITSSDNRSWQYTKQWMEDGTGDKVRPMTCQGLYTSHPVSILAWMKDHEPVNYQRIRWVFSMKDFLVYRMTGQAVSDCCNQSGGSFMNLFTGQYEKSILEYLGISEVYEKLPPLYQPADVCGTVTKKAAAQTGLKAGTRVVTGMFDVDACSVAMGMVSGDQLCMIAGTCSVNAYLGCKPVTDKNIGLNSLYCIPGYYFIEEGSNTSAGNLEWVIKALYHGEAEECSRKGKSVYDLLNQAVEGIGLDDGKVVFLPFLNGSMDSSRSRGVWLGMSPLDCREHMVRAAYEGVVFSHRYHVERLLKTRETPSAIRLSGGVTKSNVWLQMFADILQLPMEIVDGAELGAKGAAIAAAIGAGFYRDFMEASMETVKIKKAVMPNQGRKAVYDGKYGNFIKTMNALHGLWEDIF